jgi:hypothetical protein
MRVYRLLAGLVGEAVSRHSHPDQQNAPAMRAVTAPDAIPRITSQMQGFRGDDKSVPMPARTHWFGKICGAATKIAREFRDLGRSVKNASAINQRARRIPLPKVQLNVAIPAVVTALVIAGCWIARDRPVLHRDSSSQERSTAAEPQIRFVPPKLSPAKAPSSAFRMVRVGPNEVDYIAEDVTIRQLTTKPALRVRDGYKQVQLGEDVTVRYFASKPAVVGQARSGSTVAPSAR